MAHFKILSRWDSGKILYEGEAETLKDLVNTAVKNRADLRGADLRGADLRGANLREADLRGADLRGADLRGANLSSANLSSANLSSADLSSANLSSADLREADLSGADLRGADLSSANLSSANLREADLRGADLSSANLSSANLSSANLSSADLTGISEFRYRNPLQILRDQVGTLRAYKAVTSDGIGPYVLENGYQPEIKFEVGGSYKVKNANTDDQTECGAGINVATLDWCRRLCADKENAVRILIVEFEAKDIAAIPIVSDGKFRLFRCKVVGEWKETKPVKKAPAKKTPVVKKTVKKAPAPRKTKKAV